MDDPVLRLGAYLAAMFGGFGFGMAFGLAAGRKGALLELAHFAVSSTKLHRRPDESDAEFVARVDERASVYAWQRLRELLKMGVKA